MITTTIKEALEGSLDSISGKHKIYIIRDQEWILYVGKSVNIARRLVQHISPKGRIGADEIGDLVWENRPQSLNWQVDALTLEDCLSIVVQRYPRYNVDDLPDEDTTEVELIAHYHPCINSISNVAPGPWPKHIKRYELEAGKTDNIY